MEATGAAVFTAALALCAPAGAQDAGAIPLPAQITPRNGAFTLDAATRIQVPQHRPEAEQSAHYVADLWKRTNGLQVPVISKDGRTPGTSVIRFEQQSGYGPEAYRLEVTPQRITVTASTGAGLFYGAVTLWQLLPVNPGGGTIPAQTIVDEPRYPWRGLMLDSSRHFQSPAFVRSMIDWMSWHKLNVLHWHLTDDQGWRIEIRKYPRLTSVGAWRIPAVVAGSATPPSYGGYYTQDEIRGIVAFAASRHVRIVPEIDMPGHAQAAIAAYPELGSIDGKPSLPVSNRWGVHSHLFNLEPATFEFLENVLDEVLQLFPSHFIHIGGDEAVKDEWNASAGVQARARKLGIHDAAALQTYFTQKIGRYLLAHGRRVVGWDEIMQPGLSSGAVVMAWHGAKAAHAAAIRGNDTVLAPAPEMYFDNRQSSLPTEPPGRLAVSSLENVYRFEPYDPQLTELQRRHILGLQADLWTEHIQTEQRVEWMALPRAAAVAEVAWSAQPRSWPDFLERLNSMAVRYRAFGLHYADSTWNSHLDAHSGARRSSHDLDQCSHGVGLLLEPRAAVSPGDAPLAVDIMNPCWIYRDVDLQQGPQISVAVAALPFNYELGEDAAKIRVGDNKTPVGELEVRVDGCDGTLLKALPLPPAAGADRRTELPPQKLPALAGRHDVCLRFARPSLDPLWALDWVEIGT
jgi:hexosaminidase